MNKATSFKKHIQKDRIIIRMMKRSIDKGMSVSEAKNKAEKTYKAGGLR